MCMCAFMLHMNSVAVAGKSRKHRRRQSKMVESHSQTAGGEGSRQQARQGTHILYVEHAEGPLIVCARHIYNGAPEVMQLFIYRYYAMYISVHFVVAFACLVAARALRRCQHKRYKRQAPLCYYERIGDALSGGAQAGGTRARSDATEEDALRI